MALEDAISQIISKRKINNLSEFCAYQLLYNSLSEQDKKTIDAAWAKNYPTNLIIQALRSEGHKASADTMRAHQNGTCKCPK